MKMNMSLLFINYSLAITIDKIRVPLNPNGVAIKITGKHINAIDKDIFKKYTHVTKLRISGTSLTDLPEGIELLTELESLIFTDNEKKAMNIPLNLNRVAGLTKLKHLDLSGNQMSAIGVSIANLTSLEHLNVSRNELTTFERVLKHNTNLRHLDVSYNKIKTLDSMISNLSLIKTLNLKGNMLSKLCPQFIDLIHLKEMNISRNEFTSLPKEVYLLSNLMSCSASSNQITSIDYPESTKNNGQINTLEVEQDMQKAIEFYNTEKFVGPRNQFNIKMFNAKGYCLSNLYFLNLNNNKITEVTDAILLFQKLKILRLKNNMLQNREAAFKTMEKINCFELVLDAPQC